MSRKSLDLLIHFQAKQKGLEKGPNGFQFIFPPLSRIAENKLCNSSLRQITAFARQEHFLSSPCQKISNPYPHSS